MRTSRRLLIVVFLFAGIVLPFQDAASAPRSANDTAESISMFVYIGTYTRGKSEGIYLLSLDLRSGKLKQLHVTKSVNPSFLALHPTGKYLYAVNEISRYAGKKAGSITSFAIDRKVGTLKQLNVQSSGGAGPCHLVVDASGKAVLVANYGGGSIASLPIGTDGRLKPAATFVQHKGSSAHPTRQKGPHGHSINLDAANRFAVAADLGLDKLLVYRFHPETATLHAKPARTFSTKPKAGPRHFAFHPNGKLAFVINEMNSTLTSLSYKSRSGALAELQTISTLPAGFQGGNSTAEVQVHPSGRFVYGSNRGHDSIAIFRVNQKTGKLTAVGHESTLGKTPRNFGIDPTGKFLLAANQQTNNIVVFRIDQSTGKLKATGNSIEIPSPVCVKFLRR